MFQFPSRFDTDFPSDIMKFRRMFFKNVVQVSVGYVKSVSMGMKLHRVIASRQIAGAACQGLFWRKAMPLLLLPTYIDLLLCSHCPHVTRDKQFVKAA
jgi:hypothetical protein